ncbi:MAG: hypothetical protein Q4B10_03280, partial [Actinomycetaceae bacterium]|nr:hypothetical protein [Actinomycetaceae bacterium]
MTGKKPLPTGIHEGISDVDYHADKTSLSSSGARTLARPGGPAKFATRNRTDDPLEVANEQEANKLMQMLNRWTPATEEKFRKG